MLRLEDSFHVEQELREEGPQGSFGKACTSTTVMIPKSMSLTTLAPFFRRKRVRHAVVGVNIVMRMLLGNNVAMAAFKYKGVGISKAFLFKMNKS